MKTINRSTKTESTAAAILEYLQDGDSQKNTITIDAAGDLLFYNDDVGTDDGETVLLDNLEPDSMGDGWEDATTDDVLNWLESNCDALRPVQSLMYELAKQAAPDSARLVSYSDGRVIYDLIRDGVSTPQIAAYDPETRKLGPASYYAADQI